MFAVNARPRAIVDYGQDPNNPARGAVHDAWLRLHGFLVDVVAGGDTDPSNQFFGDGPMLQSFIGAGNPASTTVVTRNGGNADIASPIVGDSIITDPARRIFADRLRRRNQL